MNRKNHIDINYIFFGIFLIIELIIGTLSILTIHRSTLYSQTFFLIYAYGQYILEICIFAILSLVFKKILPKFLFYCFIAFSFIFFIAHIIDYILFKIMDLTFWDGLDTMFDETLENFIEMLHTTTIPFYIWISLGIISLFLPFIAILLYKLTDKLSKKRKIPLYDNLFIQMFFCIPLALLIWDFKAYSSIDPSLYDAYTRALPWKLTFIQPKILTIDNLVELKKPKQENEMISILDSMDLKTEKKPNIYIFVIESLRNDYITKETAPNLYKFKEDYISFERSLSNANCTQKSWFSLFYSNFPHYWKYYKDKKWQSGATGLYILKKTGYDINVFSAPELKYYSMIQLLFGNNANLTNSFHLFPHYHPKEACDSDIEVVNEMTKTLKPDKNVYIAFFDSTHFLYSWPKDFKAKFTPYADADSNIYSSLDNLELIKNRYRNAINFTDHLISSFFDLLKEKKLWDDAIIVVVGDHGEEFNEEGRLFHASHLSSMQTNVPIYIKLGKNQRKIPSRKLICQMDIFPTILDHLFQKHLFSELLQGESIFNETQFPFVITARYNGNRSPYEFFIHNENEKIILRFKNKKNIFKNQHIQILRYSDKNDNDLRISSKQKLIKIFEKALNRIFKN